MTPYAELQVTSNFSFLRGASHPDELVAAAAALGLAAIARGVIFVTLEDETGVANLVVRPPVFERFRRPLLAARLLAATGRIEREGRVIHVVAERLCDLTPRLRALTGAHATPSTPVYTRAAEAALEARSRDFR